MIKIHKLASYTWVEVISPTKEELRQVTNDYQTPVKFQSYMMDRHEQPGQPMMSCQGLVRWWYGRLLINRQNEC